MEISFFNNINFSLDFLTGLLSIVIIDLVLAGDNAVVIAMAARSLPLQKRKKGIILGAGAAVVLRVILTFFIARVLYFQYLKLVGGLLIAWMAAKLLTEEWSQTASATKPMTTKQAIKRIVIADVTMSLDNMLAVAGVSGDDLILLLIGLALSIFIVVLTSHFLSRLIDKYPIIIYIGSAILGKVAGEMIITDEFVIKLLNPGRALIYSFEIAFVISVIAGGKLWMKWKISKGEKLEHLHERT